MKKINTPKVKSTSYVFRISWIIFISLISILATRYILVGINDMLAVSKPSNTVMVEIPEGSSLHQIANILESKGVIKESEFFAIYAKVTKSDKKISPGIYELQSNMDYQAIINHMQNKSNIKNIVNLTFTEGMNISEFSELLEKNKVCSAEEFLKACKSDSLASKYNFIKNLPHAQERIYKLEGYLFPDTYQFYEGESIEKILNKFLSNFNKKIIEKTQLEGYSDKISIKKLAEDKSKTLDNLIIIASLIQAEALDKEDMHKVSSVIYNRLDTLATNGKNKFNEFALDHLCLDATVYYPHRSKESMKNKRIKPQSGNYDTYKIKGLPPGPICNPGIDAILAALNPEITDYYYYCHNPSGKAFYARNNTEHLQNIKKAGLKNNT